jgi:hypothetical protein
MQAGHLVEMLLAHTCDTGICRVDGQRHIGLVSRQRWSVLG